MTKTPIILNGSINLPEIAGIIKEGRRNLGINQRELAKRAGLTSVTVHRAEYGSCTNILNLCLILRTIGFDLVVTESHQEPMP